MAKKERIHITAEENLLEKFKRIAELRRWSLTTASEVALELFIKEFGSIHGIVLASEPASELEKAA